MVSLLQKFNRSAEQRALLVQFARYVLTGGAVTVLGVGVYWALVRYAGLLPLLANVGAYLASMAVGYVAHSRFSFRGHGNRDGAAGRTMRFFVVSLVSFGLNSFFVWILTGPLDGPDWSPIPAMIFVTPPIVFALNRKWVFS